MRTESKLFEAAAAVRRRLRSVLPVALAASTLGALSSAAPQENYFEFRFSLSGWDDVERANGRAMSDLGTNWAGWPGLALQYDWLRKTYLAVRSETHYLFQEAASVRRQFEERTRQLHEHEKDRQKLVEEYERYRAAAATAKPEQQAYFDAWYRRIQEWNGRVESRSQALNRERDRIAGLNRDLNARATRVGEEWSGKVDAYLASVRSELKAKKLKEIDAKIAEKRLQIKKDQKALSDYIKDSSQYAAAIEEAAELAEGARRENAWKAATSAFDLAVLREIGKLKANEAVKQSALQTLEKLFAQYDVPREQMLDWINRWRKGAKSLRAIRTKREYLEFLDDANNSVKGLNEAVRERYLEALWQGMNIVCKNPAYKLMMVGGEVYVGLFYTYRAHKAGSALVNQLLDQSPTRLQAVKALTATCEKHVKQLIELKKQRERVVSEEIVLY